MQTPISSLSLHPRSERNDDSVAQPVEHNTFNVGVLGSNPSWITKTSEKTKQTPEIQRISGVSIFQAKPQKQRIPGINRKIHTFQDTEDPSQNPEIKETFQLDAGRFLLFEPLVGFEPTTPRLQITCSGQLS